MLVKNDNQNRVGQRVGKPLATRQPSQLPEKYDERGYRYFSSKFRLPLWLPFLKCSVYLTTDELIVRRYNLFMSFRESTLSRRQYSKVQVRGHLGRYYSLEFYAYNGGGYYHLPYLFTPQEAYAIQQAFLFLPTY